MIGTDPVGRGGIAAVVAALVESGFLEHRAIRYIVSHRAQGRVAKAAAGFTAGLSLFGAVLRGRAHIVHVHSASRASFFRKSIYLALARAVGAHTVLHLHGGGFRTFVDAQKNALIRRWVVHTLERSSRVVALSAGWAEYLQAIAPAARVDVIGNPVEAPLEVQRREGAIDALVFLGALVPEKGVFELLEVFARLRPNYPALRLVMCGDGQIAQLRAEADRLGVSSVVEFPGWIGVDEKARLLSGRVAFVLPSHAEGLPMAMLEAMAFGCPVVVSAVGGIPEVIDDGCNGHLVPPRDCDALFLALSALLASPVEAVRIANAARATVLAAYSREAVLAKLNALYESLGDRIEPQPINRVE